jgi:hypothetical protein
VPSCTRRSIAHWRIPTRAEEWTRGNTWSDIEPVVKIVLLDEAQRRFEAEDRWWRENRDAKELFVSEFQYVLRQLTSTPL